MKIKSRMIITEWIEKGAIIKVEKELLDAMKTCDVKKLNSFLHEDLFFNIPIGQTVTKTMDLNSYSSGNMKIDEIKCSQQKINELYALLAKTDDNGKEN